MTMAENNNEINTFMRIESVYIITGHIIIYVKNCSVYRNTVRVTLSLEQQRSIFHHYKISNCSVIHSQNNPTDNV